MIADNEIKKSLLGDEPQRESPFKGYTLNELRFLRAVNELKISFVKERLQGAVLPGANGIGGNPLNVDSVIKYVDMALVGYRFAMRIVQLFR